MDSNYIGMTVNERLYISGLMDEFDQAVKKDDIEKVVSILKKVEIKKKSAIQAILKQLGLTAKN